jgi:mannosyltransferase
MACQSITIATRGVGIHSKLIEDGQTGFLFESGNHQELSSLLAKIVSDNHQLSTLKARTTVEENWSAKKEAEALKEVYLR